MAPDLHRNGLLSATFLLVDGGKWKKGALVEEYAMAGGGGEDSRDVFARVVPAVRTAADVIRLPADPDTARAPGPVARN